VVQSGRVPMLFIGDSVTEFWRDDPFFTRRGYVRKGMRGETSGQILARFLADMSCVGPVAVHILAGTNDLAQNQGAVSLAEILSNIGAMAELASANGVAVYLGSILPTDDYWWYPGLEPRRKILSLNAMLAEYSVTHTYKYIDYHSAMIDGHGRPRPEYLPDGVHPSTEGYAVMERVLDDVINAPGSA